MNAPAGAPRSRWRVRALLVALGLLIALALAEMSARIKLGPDFVFGAFVGPPQAICGEFDPELGWRNRAGVAVRIAARGFEYDVRINSRGQRGPERELPKPPGVLRVVLLGDSTAWGWGVGDREMWPRLVERELGSQVEIVNLAVPGYGTDQELWALESQGLSYAPDLVLLAVVQNDIQYNNGSMMQGMGKPNLVRDAASGEWSVANRPVPPPKGDGELARRHARRVLSMYSAVARLLEPPPPQPVRLDLADPNVQRAIERQWNQLVDPSFATHELLRRLRERSASAGADLLAFVIPHLVDRYLYDPSTPVPAHEAGAAFETYGTKKLAEAGRALGFETFSIDQALLAEVERGTNLDCGDEHLNARGNEIVAAVVAARLREWIERRRVGR